MISWSTKRRVIYTSITIIVLAVLIGGYLFTKLYSPPTCFDGKHNQDELGVDCGGSCRFLCPFQVEQPVILFSRAFEVVPGVYNAIAYIENANFNAAASDVPYTFTLLDKNNVVIAKRQGKTFIQPGGTTPVFEGSIVTKENIPTRTFFMFDGSIAWRRAIAPLQSPLVIQQRELKNTDSLPRLDATLRNTTIFEIPNVEVTSVIFNASGNAIATSQTVVDLIPPQSEVNLVFTWPRAFAKELEACVTPVDVMLLLDVSGSMNDDGVDPPQPLTDTKEAAETFVHRLSERDRVGLVSFASNAEVKQTLTLQTEAVARAIANLLITPEEEVGSTNTGEGILRAQQVFQDVGKREEGTGPRAQTARQVMILLTDGKANAPQEPGGEEYAREAVSRAKDAGIHLYTIGLGDKVNAGFLEQLANSPREYYPAASSRELDGIYKQISDAICERGPAVIDIIPRSPSLLPTL